MSSQGDKWAEEFQRQIQSGSYPKWPNEAMVKVIFGNYLKVTRRPNPTWRVLDVGSFLGNNLLPFAEIGCECHGVDIHPDIVAAAYKIMHARGFNCLFKEGTNRALPYEDHSFDLIISINTLHYEGNEENILLALKEFRRVLKNDGSLYLSTVGPQHEIQRRALIKGNHSYLVANYDFRNGQEFFCFDTERYLEFYLKRFFNEVEVGRVTEQLMTIPLDFLIAYCRP